MCPDEIAQFSGEAVYWFALVDSHFPRVVEGFDEFVGAHEGKWQCVDVVYLLKKAFVIRPEVLSYFLRYQHVLVPEGAPVWKDRYGLDEREYLSPEVNVELSLFRATPHVSPTTVSYKVLQQIRARNRWARYPT